MPSKTRRKVLKSSPSFRNTVKLDLDCGHTVYRKSKDKTPKTVECEHCKKAASDGD